MKSRVLVYFLISLGLTVSAQAHAPSEYTKALPKEGLAALTKPEPIKKFLDSFTSYEIRVKETGDSKTKVSNEGYFVGTLSTPVGPVQVEGPVNISSGVMELGLPVETAPQAIQHWQEQYARLPEFQNYSPQLQSVVYSEGKEMEAAYELQGEFGYLLLLHMPVEGAAVADVSEDLKFLSKFLKRVEKDKRANVILNNNRSGRRIFLILENTPQGVRAMAHHPMHSIHQFKNQKHLGVSYLDNLEDVKQLKEVKKVVKTKPAKEFLAKTGGRGRISIDGNDREGYQFSLRGVGQGEELKGTLQKGRAVFE